MTTAAENESEYTPFEDLVREAPSAAEATAAANVIVLTGLILRSDKEGMFQLALSGGHTLELNTTAVRSHKVVQETGNQRLVQIEVAADSLIGTIFPSGAHGFGVPTHLALLHATQASENGALSDFTRVGSDVPYLPPVGTYDIIFSPSVSGRAGGLVPFIIAIPHHAPQAIQMQQERSAVLAANHVPDMADPDSA